MVVARRKTLKEGAMQDLGLLKFAQITTSAENFAGWNDETIKTLTLLHFTYRKQAHAFPIFNLFEQTLLSPLNNQILYPQYNYTLGMLFLSLVDNIEEAAGKRSFDIYKLKPKKDDSYLLFSSLDFLLNSKNEEMYQFNLNTFESLEHYEYNLEKSFGQDIFSHPRYLGICRDYTYYKAFKDILKTAEFADYLKDENERIHKSKRMKNIRESKASEL